MITDETDICVKSKKFEANPFDVLVFVLATGVHHVHVLADSNPGAANRSPMSSFAQPPDRALLVPINFEAGECYYRQCDRRALIGMVGKLGVGQQ